MGRLVAALAAFCLLQATIVTGHPGDRVVDKERLHRHAQKLSEACLRRGRTLDSTCITDPEVTQGPYSWSTAQIRRNLTEDKEGVPHQLQITLVNSATCENIVGAAIEVWHCDALGIYSHFVEASMGTGTDTDDETFLRGVQYTDANGVATFDTIWAGWYTPRAMHVHIRVRFNITEVDGGEGYTGGTLLHTGQLFFSDTIVQTIAKISPYTGNKNQMTTLANDQVVSEQGGTYGLTTSTEMYAGEGYTKGVISTVVVGIDYTATSSSSSSTSTTVATPAPTPAPTTPTPTTEATPTPTTKATPTPTTKATPTPTTKATPTPTTKATPTPTTKATPTPTTKATPTPTTKATPTPMAKPTPTPTKAPPQPTNSNTGACNYQSCLSSATCCSGTKCYHLSSSTQSGMCMSSCTGWVCREM